MDESHSLGAVLAQAVAVSGAQAIGQAQTAVGQAQLAVELAPEAMWLDQLQEQSQVVVSVHCASSQALRYAQFC